MSNATGHEAVNGTGDETTDYEDALQAQQELEAQQPEIPHSSNADVVTLILGAIMIIGLVVCMTIYM